MSARPHTTLRPRDGPAIALVGFALALTALAVYLATSERLWIWALSQALLALVLLQWFVFLHEAGHHTLFRSLHANGWAGHLAGGLALIPFESWRRIHGLHHRYTGWQDLDPTTALLVPRPLRTLERLAINAAWRGLLPLFSVLYRIQNFWNLPRVFAFLPDAGVRRLIVLNAAGLFLLYAALLFAIGPLTLARLAGVGLLLSLVVQDFIILGQHTHMPTGLSGGNSVMAYGPEQQGPFTRSVLFPRWLSWWLLRFDYHELHHRYPHVPGYMLHRLNAPSANAVRWPDWLRASRRLSGTQFLFGRREQTGLDR